MLLNTKFILHHTYSCSYCCHNTILFTYQYIYLHCYHRLLRHLSLSLDDPISPTYFYIPQVLPVYTICKLTRCPRSLTRKQHFFDGILSVQTYIHRYANASLSASCIIHTIHYPSFQQLIHARHASIAANTEHTHTHTILIYEE